MTIGIVDSDISLLIRVIGQYFLVYRRLQIVVYSFKEFTRKKHSADLYNNSLIERTSQEHIRKSNKISVNIHLIF